MPLPSLLQVIDSALAISIHVLFNGLPPLSFLFGGACKGQQASEIGDACQMLVEKGMGERSQACVGGADVRRLYDNQLPIRLAHWLTSHGMHKSLAAAFITLHLVPARIVIVAGCAFLFTNCTISTIAGSRSANAASRIPSRDAVSKSSAVVEECA